MPNSSEGVPLSRDELRERLESLVYLVLTVRRSVGKAAEELAVCSRADQERFLASVEWIAET